MDGQNKMSSSVKHNGLIPTIFLSDNLKQIRTKINKLCFSGGKDTAEEQREKGANLDVDMAYKYLQYFEYDDKKLEELATNYGSGKMLTGEIKQILADKIWEMVRKHNEMKSMITNELFDQFYSV